MKVRRVSKVEGVRQVLEAAKRTQVRVGFFNTATYADGTPVAYVATIHEFGYPAGGIPARPFMRPTVESKREEWATNVRAALASAILAAEPSKLYSNLEQVGGRAAGDISYTIKRVNTPPLAASTLAARQSRKKTPGVSKKPLVDTGKMIQSVTYAVVTS
jgi:hypothetical protein